MNSCMRSIPEVEKDISGDLIDLISDSALGIICMWIDSIYRPDWIETAVKVSLSVRPTVDGRHHLSPFA